jgi:superfamily II DNA or RNA helicase
MDDVEIEIEDEPPAAAMPLHALLEPSAKRVKTEEIFKKPIWSDPKVTMLRKHGQAIVPHALLTTAYFVPIKLLQQLGIRVALIDVLTARPKSKKFQGRETRVPWPMFHERGEYLAIPRYFGCEVFGTPVQSRIHDGLAVQLAPTTPLMTAETCKERNGIDQQTAVNAIEAFLTTKAAKYGFGSGMFCVPPGFGKTCCAAHIIQRLGRKALFVVPNEPFLLQVALEMKKFLGDTVSVGTLRSSVERNWDIKDKDIVIAMANSVSNIGYDLSEFGTVIVDECHETATAMYSQMFYRFGAKYVLGLTATPERAADHCGAYLEWLCGPIIWHQTRNVSELRWGGVNVTVYDVKYKNHPIREVLMKSGEPYTEAMTRQIINHHSRNEFLYHTVLLPRLRVGRRILVLGTRIEHMELLHHELQQRFGVDAGIIVGMHSDGRKPNSNDRTLAQQKPILIASVAIVSKALNIPELDTMLVLSGGSYVNDTFWQQAVGRITRDHAKKQSPELILMRDRYASKMGGHGVFATCVDAACRTLRTRSPDGFFFETISVEI